jgi:hypothetical protein
MNKKNSLFNMLDNIRSYIKSSFSSLFKEFYDEQNKPKVYTTTNCYYNSNKFSCYFYEWSNINNRPRIFTSRAELYKFLDDSKIEYSPVQKELIDKENWIYGSCVPGVSKLLLKQNYYLMKCALENNNIND